MVLALIGLVVVVVVVLGSLRRLGVVTQSLQRRLLDGQKRLQPALDTLQARGDELQPALRRMEALAAKRGSQDS